MAEKLQNNFRFQENLQLNGDGKIGKKTEQGWTLYGSNKVVMMMMMMMVMMMVAVMMKATFDHEDNTTWSNKKR